MKIFKQVKSNAPLLAMALPGIVYLIMFAYIPMFGIILAFKNFNYFDGIIYSPWVGLENFKFLIMSGQAARLLRNTLFYSIIFLTVGKAVEIFLAIMYDSLSKSKLTRFNQTVSILPTFLSWVVVSYFVSALLNPERGIINTALGLNIDWYNEPKYWPVILIVVNIWKSAGYGSIIYFSNIRGFDAELYEAARIDGATWWQQVKYITLPLLKSIIILMLIMSIGGILHSDIGLFYNVTQNSGPLYETTQNLDAYIYNGITGGASANYTQTMAASFFQSVVGFLLVLTANGIIRKVSPESAMF